MNVENMIDEIQTLKDNKKQKESEIENIKETIINTKNDFYETNENYNDVVNKYKELDELFKDDAENSLTTLNNQLCKIIQKCLDKLISKRVDLDYDLMGKDRYGSNRNLHLGLNYNGIGSIHKSYYGNRVQTKLITDLDTLLTILNNKELVDLIKSKIFKKEKKEMIDVLHTLLKDWKSKPIDTKDIRIAYKDIYYQNRKDSYSYGSNSEEWNTKFIKGIAKEIRFKTYNNSRWVGNQSVETTTPTIVIKIDVNGDIKNQTIYSVDKPSSYSGYDEKDQMFIASQVWDILGKHIKDMIDDIKIQQQKKMVLLKTIWNKVNPYLIVESL